MASFVITALISTYISYANELVQLNLEKQGKIQLKKY